LKTITIWINYYKPEEGWSFLEADVFYQCLSTSINIAPDPPDSKAGIIVMRAAILLPSAPKTGHISWENARIVKCIYRAWVQLFGIVGKIFRSIFLMRH
jgi:hypothetical protein